MIVRVICGALLVQKDSFLLCKNGEGPWRLPYGQAVLRDFMHGTDMLEIVCRREVGKIIGQEPYSLEPLKTMLLKTKGKNAVLLSFFLNNFNDKVITQPPWKFLWTNVFGPFPQISAEVEPVLNAYFKRT